MKHKTWMLSLLALAGNSTAAEFDFAPYVPNAMTYESIAVTIGDINADGRDDLVVLTRGIPDSTIHYSLLVYKQLPSGSFATPEEYNHTDDPHFAFVKLGDTNNDGVNDIIVSNSTSISIFSSTRGGAFVRQDIPADMMCLDIATGDIDLDGNTDLVCRGMAKTVIHYGNGESGIDHSSDLASGNFNDVKVGDVNGDGLADIVVMSGQTRELLVYPNTGHGVSAPLSYPEPATDSWSVSALEVGDFNGDGRNDVVVSISANSPTSSIWIYSQNSLGTLNDPFRMASYDIPETMVATDLDRDGLQDLLVGHQGWLALGRYMQRNSGLTPELLSPAPYNARLHSLAVGDINGDQCTDAAKVDSSVGLALFHGMNCLTPTRRAGPTDDFNGDGKSDLFWRNTVNGTNAIWRSANYATPQVVTGVTNTAWSVIGTGDFNGDRKADLLWHSSTTGANAIWRSGIQATPQSVTQVTDPLWKIVGVGDFDGDGKHDLLWRHDSNGRNAMWRSANSNAQRSIAALANPQWQVAGVGDFDADGRDDILWHNDSTGSSMIWPSGDRLKQRYIIKVTNPAWVIAGVGDFDGDKHSDILWRDTTTGVNAIWKQGYYSRQQSVSTLASTQWQVVATGDYDGDGRHDVAWRNNATGENIVWRSANAHTPLDITDITNLQWEVQP